MVALIHKRWQQGWDDLAIATELSEKGYHSARSDCVSAFAVGRLRVNHGWRRVNMRDHIILEGHLSVRELANLLGVSRSSIYSRIRRGVIPTEFVTRHPKYDRLFIRHDPAILNTIRGMMKNAQSQ